MKSFSKRAVVLAAIACMALLGCARLEQRVHDRTAVMHDNFNTLMSPAEPPPPPLPRFHPVPTRPAFSPR